MLQNYNRVGRCVVDEILFEIPVLLIVFPLPQIMMVGLGLHGIISCRKGGR